MSGFIGKLTSLFGGKTGSSELYPAVYGTLHNDSIHGIEYLQDFVAWTYDEGARSIGLELSNAHMRDEGASSYFKSLALHAQKLGMKVVPLVKDKTWTETRIISMAIVFINEEGVFDQAALDGHINRYRRRLASFDFNAPPEVGQATQKKLQRLEAIRDYLQSIGYDTERFARDWTEQVAERQDRDMHGSIKQQKPDLAFLGQEHFFTLPPIKGYGRHNLNYITIPNGVSLEEHRARPNHFPDLEVRYGPGAVLDFMEAARALWSSLDPNRGEPAMIDAAQQALAQDTDFFPLVMRTFKHPFVYLTPRDNMPVITMSVSLARQRAVEIFTQFA